MRDNKAKILVNCSECDLIDKGVFCGTDKKTLNEIAKYKVGRDYKKGQTIFVDEEEMKDFIGFLGGI